MRLIFLCLLLLSASRLAAQDTPCPSDRWLGPEAVAGNGICLPADPARRIAVLDPFYNLQMALSLDLPVIAAPLGTGVASDIAALLGADVTDLGTFTEPNIEALLAAAPDLILGDAFMHREFLDLLSGIAPTVLIAEPSWKDYLRTVARAGGAAEQAEAQLAGYEDEVADLRQERQAGASVSFVRVLPGAFQVYVDGPVAYAPMQVLRDAGLSRPPFETVADQTVLKRPGLEGLGALTGETLIYVIGGAEHRADPAALRDDLFAQPAWQALPAVRAGRAFEVAPQHWLGFGGTHSARAILGDLRRIYSAN